VVERERCLAAADAAEQVGEVGQVLGDEVDDRDFR